MSGRAGTQSEGRRGLKGREGDRRFWRRWLSRLACAAALIWLVMEGGRCVAAFNRSLGICVVRLSQEAAVAEIRNMREDWQKENEEDAFPAVFWQEQKGVWVRNESWGRQARVTELAVCGGSGLLFPGQALLSEGDEEGCLIDRETSWRLFGDTAAIGGMVEYQGQTYRVRGVLQESTPVFVRTAKGDEAVSCLAVNESVRRNFWERLQNQSGLSGRLSVCFQWDGRWLKSEGEAGEKIREILYGENNVLEIRYLEQVARMAAIGGATIGTAVAFVCLWLRTRKRNGCNAVDILSLK